MTAPRRGAAKAGRVLSTTAVLTSSRANLRRLRGAHAEIEESLRREAAARGFLDNADRVAAAGVPRRSERWKLLVHAPVELDA